LRKSVVRYLLLILPAAFLFCISCQNKEVKNTLFDVIPVSQTGIDFNNKLTPLPELNMLKYMYFYNGAGVGAGDFNNDGLIDLFFAGNQVTSKLYLNTGNLTFKDVTKQSGIPDDKGWSTGVSVVDINNDGLLDIYVCRVGRFESLKGHNLLLVCTGIGKDSIPIYADKSIEYGLDFSGFSTQAAFFDYDLDGDLDMYLLNHSLRYNSTFNERSYYKNNYDTLSGDRMYRNEKGKYIDVTREAGINSSVIGYGLGICVSDINLDGYPDIYIANDFHENDYLYINQQNGSFKDVSPESLMHTSQFSMGVDVADINNDAFPEIITLDMLPEDPYILRRSLGEDEYNLFRMKTKYGYQHQYTRNNLQLNRRNGMFSEIGLYSGIAATDWSWSPLWMDFDNDGNKDLFISNGIPKRLNDIDYVNYISGEAIQSRIRSNKMGSDDLAFIDKFPQIKLRNKFFHNAGDTRFEDVKASIGNDRETYSNGAVYADLDNDGDLDIVVNNIDDQAMVYRNNANNKNYIRLNLKGNDANLRAVGARAVLYRGNDILSFEKYPVRGFQSSMEIPLLMGVDSLAIDSLVLIWADNSYEKIDLKPATNQYTVNYRQGLPVFDFNSLYPRESKPAFENITVATGLDYIHTENDFVEFNREPLIPFMVSTEGPALAVGDMNKDGREDIYFGASKGFKSALFLQADGGRFIRSVQSALDADSVYEDVDATWADVNGDGYTDLLVASGGNEYYGKDEHLLPRLYINEGGKRLVKATAFRDIDITASCIVAQDFNKDGHIDLFLGGRAVPFAYGTIPRSYILINDGKGNFSDMTSVLAPGLAQVGMVKDAELADADGDKDLDLVLALEWGGIVAFTNEKTGYVKKILTAAKGWWNFIRAVDIDNDGDMDFIAGNLGGNSRLKATREEPVRLYLNDFDGNGTRDQVLTYYLDGKEIPFANKTELEKQMPVLKKKFLYAADFAKATMSEIFEKDKLNTAQVLSADQFANSLLINDGKGKFTLQVLPPAAQYTPYRDAAIMDYNNDGLKDILIAGNFYGNNIQLGRSDADFGTLLINKGKGSMDPMQLPGLIIKGEVRKISPLATGLYPAWVLARNNDSAMIISIQGNKPAVSPPANR
jgi:enediyne biosynthesis protein E4